MELKFYISLRAARLLKENGYNEETDHFIDDDGDIFEDKYCMNENLPDWRWSCPSKAEAIDWLDKNGIIIEVTNINKDKWSYIIFIDDHETYSSSDYDIYFQTRLEAEDMGIIKSLELVKIKNK